MSEKSEQFTNQEMQSALALLVWKNENLRNEILKNPREVIERELKVKFDEEIKVKVVNQTESNEVVFVLPYNIHKAVGHELSDDQLEEVAGGGVIGDALRGVVREYAPQAGAFLGDQAGSGVQALGGMAGVKLPDTGLGKTIGGAIGQAISDKM